jgi:hypothetical protein
MCKNVCGNVYVRMCVEMYMREGVWKCMWENECGNVCVRMCVEMYRMTNECGNVCMRMSVEMYVRE